MAQADLNVANQSGSAFRADLNNQLLALGTLMSGASAPSTTYAYMLWADTANGVLKIRNAANNAWITLGKLDGTQTLIGTSTALTNAYAIATALTPALQIESSNANGASLSITRHTSAAANLLLQRGVTGTPVAADEAVGQIGFNGFDGTDYFNAALIRGVVDGTPGTGSMPGRLSLQTTPTGSTTPVERLRIDSTGQIQAAALGTAAAPIYSFVADTDTGIYSPGANQVAISTNGVQRIDIEADGDINIDGGGVFYDATNNRLAIGTTSPSTLLHLAAATAVDVYTRYQNSLTDTYVGTKSDGALNIFQANAYPITLATNGSERARIDSSGRLLVGTSTARAVFGNTTATAALQIEGSTADTANVSITRATGNAGTPLLTFAKSRGSVGGTPTVVASGDGVGLIAFEGADGTEFVRAASIFAEVDGTPGANDMPGRIVLATTADGASSPTERMRIANTGQLNVFSSDAVLVPRTAASAGTSTSLLTGRHSATVNDTGGTISVHIWSNGNIVNTNNSYGAISDIKLKENIIDATSQWSDIKALQVRKYNFKEGQTHTQIGLVAQEVELVSPGLVSESPDRDEDGNDLGTVTKSVNYSVLYMKAVKALQEAMERIETLEQRLNDAGIN